jgi:hypothetical protein
VAIAREQHRSRQSDRTRTYNHDAPHGSPLHRLVLQLLTDGLFCVHR